MVSIILYRAQQDKIATDEVNHKRAESRRKKHITELHKQVRISIIIKLLIIPYCVDKDTRERGRGNSHKACLL